MASKFQVTAYSSIDSFIVNVDMISDKFAHHVFILLLLFSFCLRQNVDMPAPKHKRQLAIFLLASFWHNMVTWIFLSS